MLTLSDVETTELELLDVKTELDDGVDDEVLTNGVLLISIDEVSTIDVVGVCKVVDGWTDSIDVVTGLNVLTLSDVETTELELLDVKAELDDGVDDEVLMNGCLLYTSPSPRDRTRSRMPSSA